MILDNFAKAKTQIALSNVANKRKPRTPLLKTIFKIAEPVKTTTVELTYDTATGKVLPTSTRAATNTKNSGNTIGTKTRNGKVLNALHVVGFGAIDSDDIQDIPELTDSKSLESFESYVSGEVNAIEDHLEATREYHAMGALKGKVVDADGSTELYDLHTLFGLTKGKTEITAAHLGQADKFRSALHDAKSAAKKKLPNSYIKGFVMFCGAGAYKKFAFAKDTTVETRNNQLKYVVDGFSDGFNYQSIDFVEYDGGIGETSFIGEDEALLLPIVEGLYKLVPTAGRGTDHVNKRGQKTFITTKIEDHNTGIELKGQSNYVVYVEVPDAIQHIEVK